MADHPQAPTSKLLEIIKTGKPPKNETENQQKTANIVPKKIKETTAKISQKKEESETEKQDGISISGNYYKVPNIVDDHIVGTLSTPEEIVYRHIIRLSWGWNRNWCKVGTHYFQEKSSLKSRKAIRDAINRLLERKLIKYHIVNGKIERDQDGTVYIVPLPTGSSILGNSILSDSILPNSIPDETLQNEQNSTSILDNSILDNSILDNSILGDNTLRILDNSILQDSIPDLDQHETSEKEGILPNSILPNDPIKYIFKNSLKNTLSLRDICTLFYKGIGQEKISKQKRERAEVDIKKLLEEGFTLEDIQYAVKWTLENAKEELYDFSIINHTIGQAMAEKGKAEKKEIENLERERILAEKRAEEEQQEKLLEKVKEYKNNLDNNQRKQLREKALNSLRNMKGIREEFITETLIEAKENEIIAEKLGIEISEIA